MTTNKFIKIFFIGILLFGQSLLEEDQQPKDQDQNQNLDVQKNSEKKDDSLQDSIPQNNTDDIPMKLPIKLTLVKPKENQPLETQKTENQTKQQKPEENKTVENKLEEIKPEEKLPKETQTLETQPIEQQPIEQQPQEKQPVETQPVEKQPVETQPVETQPQEKQPVETQPVEAQPTQNQPEDKKPEEKKTEEKIPKETQPKETQPVENNQQKNQEKEEMKKELEKQLLEQKQKELELQKKELEYLKQFEKEIEDLIHSPQINKNYENKNPYSILDNSIKEKPKKSQADLSNFLTIGDKELKENEKIEFLYDTLFISLKAEIYKKQYMVFKVDKEVILRFNYRPNSKKYSKELATFHTKDYIIIETNKLMIYQDEYQLEIKVQQNFDVVQRIGIIYYQTEFLEFDFNKTINLNVELIDSLDIELTADQKLLSEKNDKNRIQLFLREDLDSQLITPDTSMQMFINENKKTFPTAQKHDLVTYGFLENGLVKTINSNNKNYCLNKSECKYQIRILMNNIKNIKFYSSVYPNNSIISFQKNLKAVEELVNNEIVYYTFNVPEDSYGWIYETDVIMGKVESFLQPDKKPQQLKDYQFKTEGQGIEKIVITKDILRHEQWSGKVFQLGLKCNVKQTPCVFNFKFYQISNEKIIPFKEDQLLSGRLYNNEVINLQMDLFTGHKETFQIDFELKNTDENLDLLAIDCINKNKNCLADKRTVSDQSYLNKSQKYLKKVEKNKWSLQVNCLGSNPFISRQEFQNQFPISEKCVFNLILFSEENKIVDFQILSKGTPILKELNFYDTTRVQMFAFESQKYHANIKITDHSYQKYILVRGTILEGQVLMKMSINNDDLDKDNVKQIQLSSTKDEKIEANQEFKYLKVPKNTKSFDLYIQINSFQYTILDMDIQFSEDQNSPYQRLAERILPGNLLLRSIKEYDYIRTEHESLYYYSLYFKMEDEYQKNSFFEININAEEIDLEICVQKNKNYIHGMKCSSEIQGNQLIVKQQNGKFSKDYVIQVIKRIKDKQIFQAFPIVFSIFINFPEEEKQLNEIPSGQQIVKHINPQSTVIFKFDMRKMKKYGYVLFTTHSLYHKAVVKTSHKSENTLVTLDKNNFGFKIHSSKQFKNEFCTKSCDLFIYINSTDILRGKFSLLYLLDDDVIRIREGEQLFVPSDNKLFFYYPTEGKKMINMDFESEHKQILYADKFEGYELNQLVREYISEGYYSFKSQYGTRGEIFVDNKFLKKNKAMNGMIFMIVPKESFMNSLQDGSIQIFDNYRKTRITLHTKYQMLTPYSEIHERLYKGDVKYYQFQIEEPKNFEIFLSIQSGNAQMYLQKGVGKLPSFQKYFKKGDSYHDKEIIVQKSDFDDPKQLTGTYHLAVYANQSTHYTLFLTNHFANVRRIKFQQLNTLNLKKDQYYYLDYLNKEDNLDTYTYSDNSDVDIALIIYDEKQGESMLNKVENNNGVEQQFTLNKQGNPRKKQNLKALKQSHYVIRLLSKEDTNLDFAIYQQKNPLQIPIHKSVLFGMGENDEQIFLVRLHDEHQEVDIELNMHFGSITFEVSDNNKEYQGYKTIQNETQYNYKYKDDKTTDDIVVFKDIYIKIKSKIESLFRLRITPKNSFKMMQPFMKELVQLTQEDQYFYFAVNEKQLKKIKKLVIYISHIQYFDPDPELLFMSNNDIILDENTPFIPLAIKNRFEKKINEVKQIQIEPQLYHGIYVLKIKSSNLKHKVKIFYSINDDQILEPNGIFQNILPFEETSNRFKIYMPSQGEFRLLLDKCVRMDLVNTTFINKIGQKDDVEMEKNFAQAYPYIYLDQATHSKFSSEKLILPIQRLDITESGLLSFELEKLIKTSHDYYQITTEFLNKSQKLMLKDYIDLNHEKIEDLVSFNSTNGNLSFKIKAPKFKTQFFDDLDYKYIKMELFINIIQATDFKQQFDQCGYRIMSQYEGKSIQHSIIKKLTFKDYNVDSYYTPVFDKTELEKFYDSNFFGVVSVLRIHLYNTEDEEYDVLLNQKFTEIPYFVLRLKNPLMKGLLSLNREPDFKNLFIAMFIGFVILILFLIVKKMRKKKDQDKTYNQPKQEEIPKKLEMV